MADNPHYMTPEEMSKLICPFGRGNNMPGKEITVDGSPIGKPCVSTLCAAWRWAPHRIKREVFTWIPEYCPMLVV